MRDDFNSDTIRMLQERVGHRCSNPECRAPTAGPHSDPQKAVRVGRASHITAASPGGPRFDPTMSATERRSISNGIWLCATCAALVDVDPIRVPVSLLYEWKRMAEDFAATVLGKTEPPAPDEWPGGVEYCGHCYTPVPIGAGVCSGCHAVAIRGSTPKEFDDDMKFAFMALAVTVALAVANLPRLLNYMLDTRIEPFFGHPFAILAILAPVAIIGAGLIARQVHKYRALRYGTRFLR